MIVRLAIIAGVIVLTVRHVADKIRTALAFVKRSPYKLLTDVHMADRSRIDRRASVAFGYTLSKKGAWVIRVNLPIINFILPETMSRSEVLRAMKEVMEERNMAGKTWTNDVYVIHFNGVMLLGGYTEITESTYKVYINNQYINFIKLLVTCSAYYEGYTELYMEICGRLKDMGVYGAK